MLPFFWIPEQAVRKRELRDGMPYRRWAEQGFIELSPGDVIDYRDIKARLEWACRQMFDLQEICFDPWNSRQISVPMIEEGLHLHRDPAGCRYVVRTFEEIAGAGDAVASSTTEDTRCCAGMRAVSRRRRQNDNLMFTKPERSKSSSRIDGISATVNALARAIVAAPQTNHVIEIW